MSASDLDCQACGACCAAWVHGGSFVAVTRADAERLRAHPGLMVPDAGTGTGLALTTRATADGRTTVCASLEGDPRPPVGRVRCAIHDVRPAACRVVEPGDAWCRAMRARLGFDLVPLANPEREWERPDAVTHVERGDIEARIGPVSVAPEVLSGGLANLNVRVGDGRVLRIHRRDPGVTAKEAALLRRPWRTFVVPRVLASGPDFLLLSEVPHGPIADGPAHGEELGRALAELHETRFDRAGFLGPALDVAEPFADWFDAHREHAVDALARAPALQADVRRFLAARETDLRAVGDRPVLLHGDFKASNLHRAASAPLVLDWEFAYAGPALLDVGQLFRWRPGDAFAEAFVAAYRAGGGLLPDDWRRLAAALDVVNLAGLFGGAPPASRRAADVAARIARTLADG